MSFADGKWRAWRMWRTVGPLLLLAGASLGVSSGLVGCAGPVTEASSPGRSYTDSDEPESRRRASNRQQLAVLYYQSGKFTIALDEVKQAIANDPNWDEPYWLRGLIEMQLNDLPAAEISMRKALSLNPKSPDLQHNYAGLLCRMGRASEGLALFDTALANPQYTQRAKSLLEKGNCLLNTGEKAQALVSYQKSYELDASNPVTGYHLAALYFEHREDQRAQFYIRRINNSEQATAESLWLGMKIERRLGNDEAVQQLGAQLTKRFTGSREEQAYARGAFDE